MKFALQGTEAQKEALRVALARCWYPFELVRPDITIPVTFADLKSQGAWGLFWLDGRIEVEQTLTDPMKIAEVLLSEVAHAVDQYTLTEADHMRLQATWHPTGPDEHTWWDSGPYRTWEGEAMMALFVSAFSAVPVTMTLDHKPTPEAVALLRSMAPMAPLPTGPAPYVGCKWSHVFHRRGAHWFVCGYIEWDTREDAVAVGRRPCARCHP